MATLTDSPFPAYLNDLPIRVSVVLDTKMMPVRELLALNEGSVLKLSRSAGENVDVRVASLPIAYGELVVIEDNMGVRITDFVKKD